MNLHLDTIKHSDYQRFYEWFADEKFLETYDYVFPKPMSKAEVDKMLKDYEMNEESVALAIRLENGKVIGIAGYINIDKDNQIATLFIGIGDDEEQGKGYGKLALSELINYGKNKLNLFKIQLKVLEFNHRAIELYEGAGFQKEGVQRKYCLRDNRRFDLLMYGKILYFGAMYNGEIVGKQTRLSPSALKELMERQSSTDIISIIDSPNQELTFKKLKIAFVNAGLTVNVDNFEKNVGLLNSDGKYNLMAFLLADENDISIKVVTFSGKDKTQMVKRTEYGGTCLINVIDRVLEYMVSINETKVNIGNHRREEEKLFDMASFKEAWQNACLHTKWDKGNPPAVYIFSDRVEIISTGGLPLDLNKEEFFKGISKPVNAKLQKILGQLGYVEQTGHGIPLIISNYGKQAFDIMDNYINVTIPFNFNKTQFILNENNTNLTVAEQTIVEHLQINPKVTIRELVKLCSFSDGYVRKLLNSLKNKKLIERQGGRKDGIWVVI